MFRIWNTEDRRSRYGPPIYGAHPILWDSLAHELLEIKDEAVTTGNRRRVHQWVSAMRHPRGTLEETPWVKREVRWDQRTIPRTT